MMFSTSVYSTTSNRNSTSLSEDAPTSTISSVITSKAHHEFTPSMRLSSISNHTQEHEYPYPNHQKTKKKRNLPGNPGKKFDNLDDDELNLIVSYL